jgi:hypothetical protein
MVAALRVYSRAASLSELKPTDSDYIEQDSIGAAEGISLIHWYQFTGTVYLPNSLAPHPSIKIYPDPDISEAPLGNHVVSPKLRGSGHSGLAQWIGTVDWHSGLAQWIGTVGWHSGWAQWIGTEHR